MTRSNHASPFPTWRKGQPLTRDRLNQLVDHANALSSISAGPGIEVRRSGRGVVIGLAQTFSRLAGDGGFPARIASASGAAHAWTEQQPSGGGFADLPGGRSGTTASDAAYEINGRSAVPAGTLVWMRPAVDADGVTQYRFDVGAGHGGTPVSMTYSGQHADVASSATWSVQDQPSTRGVAITVQTGQRYDASADTPRLYAYLRTLTFDANGLLVAVSGESRVTIDTPESCDE